MILKMEIETAVWRWPCYDGDCVGEEIVANDSDPGSIRGQSFQLLATVSRKGVFMLETYSMTANV